MHSGPTNRKRHVYPLLAWVSALVVLLLAVGLSLVLFLVRAPYQGYAGEDVVVSIAPRTPSMTIFTLLESKGVLRDARLGMVALKIFHRGKTLKAGEYRFAGARTPEQVVLSLVAGDVVTYRITVPEGFTAEEVFTLFSSQGFSTLRDYQALFQKPGELEGLPKDAPTLEGFLFPDTFTITRSMGAREILGAMTRQFARRLPEGFEQKARAQGLSVLEATTLASLVEKETAVPAETADRGRRLPEPPAQGNAASVRSDDDLRAEAARDLARLSRAFRAGRGRALQHVREAGPAAGSDL